jgi:hypothetical protein
MSAVGLKSAQSLKDRTEIISAVGGFLIVNDASRHPPSRDVISQLRFGIPENESFAREDQRRIMGPALY